MKSPISDDKAIIDFTEKEIEVIKYYLINDNEYANGTNISKERRLSISCPTALSSSKNLYQLGILEKKMIKPRRYGNKVPYYRLTNSTFAVKNISYNLLLHQSNNYIILYESKYFIENIDIEFIIEIIREFKIKYHHKFHFTDFSQNDQDRIIKDYAKCNHLKEKIEIKDFIDHLKLTVSIRINFPLFNECLTPDQKKNLFIESNQIPKEMLDLKNEIVENEFEINKYISHIYPSLLYHYDLVKDYYKSLNILFEFILEMVTTSPKTLLSFIQHEYNEVFILGLKRDQESFNEILINDESRYKYGFITYLVKDFLGDIFLLQKIPTSSKLKKIERISKGSDFHIKIISEKNRQYAIKADFIMTKNGINDISYEMRRLK